MSASSYLGKLVLTGMLLASMWLAHYSWRLSLNSVVLESPPLHQTQTPSTSKLLNQLTEVDRLLDFMVWPRERQSLMQRKLALTQSLLNAQPLDGERWVSAVRLQHQVDTPMLDRNWALTSALEIAGWNHKAHWDLVYACLTMAESLSVPNDQRCNQLLRHSPLRQRQAWVALRLKLEKEWVEQRFQRAAGTL